LRLRRIILVILTILLIGGIAVFWRGVLRGERIFLVSEDDGWYIECTYQRIGGKLRTYTGGWYSREMAEAEAWCPFIRR
jgi:hypothetical protein